MSLTYHSRKTEEPANRITALDGYRALAISLVVAFHYTVRWAPPHDPQSHLPDGAIFNGFILFNYGWVGVELFFVISGFVILMTLVHSRSMGDFVSRRFARLWPALLVAATLTTITLALIGPYDWAVSKYDYVTSILLVDPYLASKLLHHSDIKWVDGAYWSLWVEVRFYASAALIFLIARKNFIWFWLVLQCFVVLSGLFANNTIYITYIDFLFFPLYLPYFTLGICVYHIYIKDDMRGVAIVGSALAAVVIFYHASFTVGEIIPNIIMNCLIFVMFFLFIIDHYIIRFFKMRPIIILGQASYSLYLIHQNIGIAVMRKILQLGVPYLIVFPLTVCAMIALSILLFRFIENPAKSWMLERSKTILKMVEHRMPWLNYGLVHGKE